MTISMEQNGVFRLADEAIRFRFDTNQYFKKNYKSDIIVSIYNHDKIIYTGELEITKNGS